MRVLAQDGGTPRLSATATVYIDVERNQNQPFWGQQNYTVTINEIQDVGVPILTLSAFDQDIQVLYFVFGSRLMFKGLCHNRHYIFVQLNFSVKTL